MEKELIAKIKKLRQIKPRREWVILTKSQILGKEEVKYELFPFFKPAYASLFLLLFLVGLFDASQNALPGEPLYPLKKITERVEEVFIPEEEKPKLNLELANKRLEELSKIAEKNETRKLIPAINEYQATVSEAARNLQRIGTTTSDPVAIKKIVEETQKLTKNKEKLKTLGVVVDETEDLQEGLQSMINGQISIWKNLINDLSDEIEIKEKLLNLLNQAETYYQKGDYSQASQILVEIYLNYPQY